MNLSCLICNKQYKSIQSKWNHMNKYHNNSSNINKPINKKINTINNNCKYCNKILSDRKSRWKHEQTCKTKKSELKRIF